MTKTLKDDIALFTEIVGAMCQHPDALTVAAVDFGGVNFTLTCHHADYGLVLGRRAMNLKALRVVASALLDKHGKATTDLDEQVKLEEQTAPDLASHRPFVPKKDWDQDTVERIALAVGGSVTGGRQQADFLKINSFTTGLTLVGEAKLDERLAAALGTVLDCIAARHGHHVRFRTATAEGQPK